MKVILSNNILTVKLSDGTFLTNTEASKELYFKVISAETEEEVKALLIGTDLTPEQKKVVEHNKTVAEVEKKVSVLEKDRAFEIRDGNVYMQGVSISIPKVLVDKFSKLLEDIEAEKAKEFYSPMDLEMELDALKNFWRWAALNPNEESREDLYTFIGNNEVRITPKGNMVLYRRIVKASEGSAELTEFVSIQYVRVKKNKKNPAKFWVVIEENSGEIEYRLLFTNDGTEPELAKNQVLQGNLKDLYLDLPNLGANLYTDKHTHSLVIQVGDVYKIEEEEVDTNNGRSCSRGLHCASRNYDYSGFGETPVLVLVNPSKVRAVPTYDIGKMRVVEMFIAAVLETDDQGKYIDEDVNVIDLDDTYFNIAVDELKQLVEAEGATENKGQDVLKVKALTLVSATNILDKFEEVVEALASRVIKV